MFDFTGITIINLVKITFTFFVNVFHKMIFKIIWFMVILVVCIAVNSDRFVRLFLPEAFHDWSYQIDFDNDCALVLNVILHASIRVFNDLLIQTLYFLARTLLNLFVIYNQNLSYKELFDNILFFHGIFNAI